jgi:hypothetical protein
MAGAHAVHGRKRNGSGHVKTVRRADGSARYEARYRNRYLGTFATRAEAQAAVLRAQQASTTGAAP